MDFVSLPVFWRSCLLLTVTVVVLVGCRVKVWCWLVCVLLRGGLFYLHGFPLLDFDFKPATAHPTLQVTDSSDLISTSDLRFSSVFSPLASIYLYQLFQLSPLIV